VSETFDGLARKLLLRVPKLGPFIARDLIAKSFDDVKDFFSWSWRLKRSQLTVPNVYSTGLATVTYGSNTVTLTGAGVVDATHVGRQFRVGVASPILTITDFNSGANTYTLSEVWMGSSGTGQAFKVYQAYITMPSDFQSFWSVVDPSTYWAIQTTDVSLESLDARDPQRNVVGSPAQVLVPYDYFNGTARYELWPHQTTQSFYLMAYQSSYGNAFDTGVVIPDTLGNGDVILERGLMYAAKWPGPNFNDRNPYFGENTAQFHLKNYEKRIGVLIKEDTERMQNSIWYQGDQSGNKRNMNASWMQSHDLSRW
jgi:hypothetical protein